MSDCTFCEIVTRQEPASFVYEDGVVVAFMDIQPINPGHLLVVPRRHGTLMRNLDETTGAHAWLIATRMAEAVRGSGVRCEGVNLLIADGEAAFQDVPHFHVHVIPRYLGDGFGLTFPPAYGTPPSRGELDVISQHVRAALDARQPQ